MYKYLMPLLRPAFWMFNRPPVVARPDAVDPQVPEFVRLPEPERAEFLNLTRDAGWRLGGWVVEPQDAICIQ